MATVVGGFPFTTVSKVMASPRLVSRVVPTENSFLGIKLLEHEADHSLPSSVWERPEASIRDTDLKHRQELITTNRAVLKHFML
jgi:hypothetical protein